MAGRGVAVDEEEEEEEEEEEDDEEGSKSQARMRKACVP